MLDNLNHMKRVSKQIINLLKALNIKKCTDNSSAVFFDVDGTLSRDDGLELLISSLVKRDLLPKKIGKFDYNLMRSSYKNRDLAFNDYLKIVIDQIKHIKDLPKTTLDKIVDDLQSESGNYYLFTWLLLMRLKAMGYKLITVSGSPDFLLYKFLKKAGIFVDEMNSTKYIFEKGLFTGKIDLTVIKDKGSFLLKNYEKKFDLSKCIALGDTLNDVKMLEKVGKVITINPTYELAKIAKKRKWPIVIERKDLVLIFPKIMFELD